MKHPYYNYTTEDALCLARSLLYGPLPEPGDPTPAPAAALAAVEAAIKRSGFNWLTGEVARELLQAACGQAVKFTSGG